MFFCNLLPVHSSLGQFWNIPVMIERITDLEHSEPPQFPRYDVTLRRDGRTHSFEAFLYDLTWDHDPRPCLYAGDGQGYPAIEGNYLEYRVNSLFSTEFKYSVFRSGICSG